MRRDEFDPVARAMSGDAPVEHYEGPHWSQTRPEPGPEPTPLAFADEMTSFRVTQAILAVVCMFVGLVGGVYVISQLFQLVMSL